MKFSGTGNLVESIAAGLLYVPTAMETSLYAGYNIYSVHESAVGSYPIPGTSGSGSVLLAGGVAASIGSSGSGHSQITITSSLGQTLLSMDINPGQAVYVPIPVPDNGYLLQEGSLSLNILGSGAYTSANVCIS